MEKIIGFVVKYLLSALFDWGAKFFKKRSEIAKSDKDIDSKRDRVIAAIKAPPKGVLMTEEQRKELYEAYLALARI